MNNLKSFSIFTHLTTSQLRTVCVEDWCLKEFLFVCGSITRFEVVPVGRPPALSPDALVRWSHEGPPHGADLLQRQVQSSNSETAADRWVGTNRRSQNMNTDIITKRGIEGAVILFLLPSYFITVSKKIYILIIPNDLFPFRLHIYMLWFKSSLYWVWFGLAVGRSGGVMTPPCGEHPQTHAAALTSCLPSDKDKLLIKRTLMTFMDESSSSRYFPLVSWPRPFVGEGSPSDLTGGKCKFWGQFNSMK